MGSQALYACPQQMQDMMHSCIILCVIPDCVSVSNELHYSIMNTVDNSRPYIYGNEACTNTLPIV